MFQLKLKNLMIFYFYLPDIKDGKDFDNFNRRELSNTTRNATAPKKMYVYKNLFPSETKINFNQSP